MTATISDDGRYRYTLTRDLRPLDDLLAAGTPDDRPAVFVMLNPSTADATTDDPTIRRCVAFARREERTSLHVVNLYAYRATSPKDLADAYYEGVDIIGPDNDHHIANLLLELGQTVDDPVGVLVVAAWGAWTPRGPLWSHEQHRNDLRKVHRFRVWRVADLAGPRLPFGAALQALNVTKAGHPGHPLYVPASAPLVDWHPPTVDHR